MPVERAAGFVLPPARCRSTVSLRMSPRGKEGQLNRSRPTHLKREREKARRERQQMKVARRAEASARRAAAPRPKDGEDPDIAGIIPGPQPSPWGDEEEDREENQ